MEIFDELCKLCYNIIYIMLFNKNISCKIINAAKHRNYINCTENRICTEF